MNKLDEEFIKQFIKEHEALIEALGNEEKYVFIKTSFI
jgi:hypothetical protein